MAQNVTLQERTRRPLRVCVGAYTQDLGWVKGKAKGIALYQLDPATGQMLKQFEATADNPSFLALHPSGKFLFATNEATSFSRVICSSLRHMRDTPCEPLRRTQA